ncbi:MAG: GTPase Era [Halobacteriovoraceae bacterium]|jgi:GTPase|nr:GTPase Era [Halobacteriovoraceae bacterium]MBT5092929.1 GTPase Era [Halobacteriovoraceae bacterium]
MLVEDQHPLNKSIMVSVLGVPNVGKSSLINYLMGMNLTVVTTKPQTTRNKFHCILTVDRTEIVLVDTPGLHTTNQEFNKRLNQQATEGIVGADVNLFLVDLKRNVLAQLEECKRHFEDDIGKSWLVFTKTDLIDNAEELPLAEVFELAKGIFPSLERYFSLSPKTGDNVHLLTGAICDEAKDGPHLYGGEVSNKNERFFATEYIREQTFELLKDEIPYETAVVIDEYKDFREKETKTKLASHISASILVNRPSQRAIVIGSKGSMIKEIGTRSRKKIEAMVGGQVHLNLHVKVSPKWFKNNFVLEELGLPRAQTSNRVWRAK